MLVMVGELLVPYINEELDYGAIKPEVQSHCKVLDISRRSTRYRRLMACRWRLTDHAGTVGAFRTIVSPSTGLLVGSAYVDPRT